MSDHANSEFTIDPDVAQGFGRNRMTNSETAS
jgi:hypothetical protein